MKKILAIIFAALCTLVSIFACGCFPYDLSSDNDNIGDLIGGGTTSKPNLEIIGELNMSYEYSSYLGYSAEIKGIVKNNSNKTYSYVAIEFAVYDVNGNNIGTALDNINNLYPGDTWAFTANLFISETQPKSCKLVELYGF